MRAYLKILEPGGYSPTSFPLTPPSPGGEAGCTAIELRRNGFFPNLNLNVQEPEPSKIKIRTKIKSLPGAVSLSGLIRRQWRQGEGETRRI